jgi:hypothetical protein
MARSNTRQVCNLKPANKDAGARPEDSNSPERPLVRGQRSPSDRKKKTLAGSPQTREDAETCMGVEAYLLSSPTPSSHTTRATSIGSTSSADSVMSTEYLPSTHPSHSTQSTPSRRLGRPPRTSMHKATAKYVAGLHNSPKVKRFVQAYKTFNPDPLVETEEV